MSNFQKGSAAAAKSGGGSFTRGFQTFSLKEGERALVRFLTDANPVPSGQGGWITVWQHNFVQTKPAPATKVKEGEKAPSWPTHMTAVCRKDDQLGFGECFLCSAGIKRVKRTWALVAMREEVADEQGRKIGIRDVKKDVTTKVDGKEVTTSEPDIRIVNMAWKNFFARIDVYNSYHGTILDRDYVITRTGDKLDTDYGSIGLDPIPLASGEIYDLRNPELMAKYLPTAKEEGYAAASDTVLGGIVENKASDDYYAKFFDTRVTYTEGKTGEDGAQATPAVVAPAPDNDAAEVDLEQLKARITGHTEEAPAAAPAAAPEPVAVNAEPPKVLALD